MNYFIPVISFAFMACLPQSALAARWVELAPWGDWEVRIDAESLEIDGDYREFWLEYDASQDQSVNWVTAKVLHKINCNSRQIKTIHGTFYDGGRKVLDSSTDRYADWEYITPESNWDDLRVVVCSI